MDDELTEEEKRKRRVGGDIDMMLDELAAHRAKTRPQWREVEGAWEMSVNGQVVAALLPNGDPNFPDIAFLSQIVTNELPTHGWDAVDFATLEDAQHDVEQWWHHARRGEAYRPEDGPAQPSVANENNPERVAALDTRDGREGAEGLTGDDVAERVQQLIDDPTRLAEEIDQGVLDALDARRATEVVQPERSAEEEQRLYEATETEPERCEVPAAPALDAAMPQEMTDDAQIQYSRWTGERLSPETGPSRDAGHTLGGGMGRSR